MLSPESFEVVLGVRHDGIVANLPITEARMIELNIRSCRNLVKGTL